MLCSGCQNCSFRDSLCSNLFSCFFHIFVFRCTKTPNDVLKTASVDKRQNVCMLEYMVQGVVGREHTFFMFRVKRSLKLFQIMILKLLAVFWMRSHTFLLPCIPDMVQLPAVHGNDWLIVSVTNRMYVLILTNRMYVFLILYIISCIVVTFLSYYTEFLSYQCLHFKCWHE